MLLWIYTSSHCTEVDKVADMVVKTLNEDFTDVTLSGNVHLTCPITKVATNLKSL